MQKPASIPAKGPFATRRYATALAAVVSTGLRNSPLVTGFQMTRSLMSVTAANSSTATVSGNGCGASALAGQPARLPQSALAPGNIYRMQILPPKAPNGTGLDMSPDRVSRTALEPVERPQLAHIEGYAA